LTPLKNKKNRDEELAPNNTVGIAAKKAVADAEAKSKIIQKQKKEQPKQMLIEATFEKSVDD
jgi:hypothetical protein